MDIVRQAIGSPPQVTACCTSGSHAGVNENQVSKRDCQAETLVIQADAPTQLLTHTKYGITEEGHVNTLLVQTETATQLTSNEAQQETQLIDGDMDGYTLVIHSDGEGSGDTEVLPDNVDLHCNSPCCAGDDESGFTSRDRMLSDGNIQYLRGPGATSALAAIKRTDVELENAEERKENCDSDATTEEVEAEDAGSLEAVAESVFHGGQRLIGGTCHLENVVDPMLVSKEKIDGEQRLIWSESPLQSTRAQQNTQITAEIENDPSEKAFEGLEPGLHGPANDCHTSQGGLCSMQTPKTTVVDEVMNDLSSHMSILRSRSGSIGSVRAASLRASGLRAAARNALSARDGNGNMDKYDSDSTIELTPEIVEDLLPYSKALKEKKSNRDLMESISVSFESNTPNTEKFKSQTAFVSHTKSQQHGGASPISKAVEEGRAFAGENCEVKSYCRKPHGQKVRKLSFESNKISDKSPASEPELVLAANKEEDSANPAINELGGMGERGSAIFPEKTVESTHGPRGELSRNLIQHGSVPSGFMSASTNLSYLESQEPGEESQLNALNVVDKLVWLNATGMSQDSGPNIVSQQNCVKSSQKAVQSLAHTVEINNIQDNMVVYDWVDSQQDDIGLSSDAKGGSAPRKKRLGVSRLVKGRKSQDVSQHNNITSRFQAVNTSDDIAVNKEKATMDSGRKVSLNTKASSQHNQSMAPQKLLAAQSRGRRRIGGTRQTQKEENMSSLEKCKKREQNKPTKESSELIEHEVSIGICPSQAGDNEKRKLQCGVDSTHKVEKESPLGSQIGSDTQMAIEAIDMLRDSLVTHEVSAERKGKRRSRVDAKYNQTRTPEGSNLKDTNLREGRSLKNGAGQETKRHQTRSVKRESTTLSKPKGGKQVSWVPLEEEQQYNTEKEDNTIKEEFVKRGLTTRSKAQDLANMLADSRTDEPCRPQNVKNNGSNTKRRSKMQGKKQDKTSPSYEQLRRADSNVLGLDQPTVKKYSLKMRKGEQPTMNIGQEDTVNEVGKGINENYNSSTSLVSDDQKKSSPLHCSINKEDNKRKRKAADKSPLDVLDSVKLQSQECLPKYEGSSVPRKRRGSLSAPDSNVRNTMAAVEEETKSAPHELKNRAPNRKDADTERELAVPAIRTTKASERKSIRRHKKEASSEPPTESGFSLIVEEGRKRKRERGCICVLFSHSLSEETSKNQKKILAKLGGHLALSAADCTHFIADCFVRTRNMLESMAAGKPVVTSLWLENCGQAHYFVDEKNYILRDAKKEKELGFSMHSSLAAAQHKPVLQGLKVLISPKTTPDQGAMTSIIQSAGGQVLESMSSFSKIDSTLNGIGPIVIASEKDREFCLPYIERGFKVYSTELILSGIVSQNLDFTRNQLYHGQQKRSSRGASTFHV